MSRLLVLGNAGADIGLRLPRLPDPGETVVGGAGGRAPGGKGLNQAVVAARAGLAPVLFHAPVGDDADGRMVARTLAAERFAALELPVSAVATDLSVLLVLPDGENAIVSAGDCAFAVPPAEAAAFAGRCGAGDWLLLQGNLLPAATAAAVVAARARGGRVMLNAAPATAGLAALLGSCDVVVANAGEARQLLGGSPYDAAGADALRDAAGADALRAASGGAAVVTLGGGGCLVAAGGVVRHHPAVAVAAVDTTGAGDAFCGVLAAALAAGWALGPAVDAAQRAAALVVTRAGAFAALPTVAELRPILAAAA